MNYYFKNDSNRDASDGLKKRSIFAPPLLFVLIIAAAIGIVSVFISREAISKKIFYPASLIKISVEEPLVTELSVKKDDTFFSIIGGLGMTRDEVIFLTKQLEKLYDTKNIKEGDVVRAIKVGTEIKRIEYLYEDLEGLYFERDEEAEGGFRAGTFDVPYAISEKTDSSVIENSLYEAGVESGIVSKIIMELTDIFAWDVDFSTEIKKGDAFSVLYEQILVNGKPPRPGRILGAKVTNEGKTYSAVYYMDASGKGDYYEPSGKSLRRTLLKSPLRYRRISSYFSKKRFHPILKRYRPHHGIDYAAPTGTPVEASGDGKITFAGWKGGYGNLVEIRHNSAYTTRYGHLSKIKKGVKPGKKIGQGDVIGYVGSTGISTGPHLHYEVRKNHGLINPLSIATESAKTLKGKELQVFLSLKETVMAKLSGTETLVASKEK